MLLVTYGITTILSLMYKDSFFGNASIGKKILRIKVVENGGTKLNFIASFKRTLPLKEIAKHCELVDVYKSRRGKFN